MARMDIQERMEKVVEALRGMCGPLALDIERECKDDWARDYAIIVVHIAEPDDNLRDSIDIDRVHTNITEMVLKTVGRTAFFVRGLGKAPRDGQSVVVRRQQLSDWTMEFEVYRTGVERNNPKLGAALGGKLLKQFVLVHDPDASPKSYWTGTRWAKDATKAKPYTGHNGEGDVRKVRARGFSKAALVLRHEPDTSTSCTS